MDPTSKPDSLLPGIALIVTVGIALGLGYNWLGLQEGAGWGIAWKGVDRVEELNEMPAVEAVEADAVPASADPYNVDPLAIPAAAPETPTGPVPEVPDFGRPVPIELEAVKQLHDANAALFIDAREDWEFAEGRIPGAVSLPHEEAITDPALLEQLETGGRPIVTYCGGGTCEISLSLAWELLGVGHTRIAVYMGGYPEWVDAGYPVESAEGGS